MKIVYIYCLKHPETKKIRYVGKTHNIKRRLYQHIYNSQSNCFKKTKNNKQMKKVIFMLLAFITLNSNANTVTTLLDKTSEIVDSTKKTVKESITSVDTSSNFKMLYQDVKEGLSGLATGLKVGVEHVYTILVK